MSPPPASGKRVLKDEPGQAHGQSGSRVAGPCPSSCFDRE